MSQHGVTEGLIRFERDIVDPMHRYHLRLVRLPWMSRPGNYVMQPRGSGAEVVEIVLKYQSDARGPPIPSKGYALLFPTVDAGSLGGRGREDVEEKLAKLYETPGVIAPPPVVKGGNHEEFVNMMDWLWEIAGNYRPIYFVPHYTPAERVDELISRYLTRYGIEGPLIALDCGGQRFSNDAILWKFSLTLEALDRRGVHGYGLYLFDAKPYKQSADDSPPEELLSILNGVNVVGLYHTKRRFPKEIAESILKKMGKRARYFDERAYLYKRRIVKDMLEYLELQRDAKKKLNEIALKLIDEGSIERIFNDEEKSTFSRQLTAVSAKVVKNLPSSQVGLWDIITGSS